MDPSLPINLRRDEIAALIAAHQVIILCGETGSGKTTQLPQICLALSRGTRGMIAHTQPRRLAARSVAARIAEETGTRLGDLIGVKVRFQDTTSKATRVKLLTDGMLLAELAGDPLLKSYDTIIIDEAHERSLNVDFLLGVLRRLLPRRPDLKLIVTSATIDPRRFADYFSQPGSPPVPVIEVSGRTYPVELRYRPCADDEDEFERLEVGAVVDAVDELSSPRLPEGDILVFLPGEREIRLCADAVRRSAAAYDLEVLPLFARLTSAEQDRIFRTGGRRRVILSTNIAETSLTVPGIRYVVDTGLARLNRYDPQKKVQRLPIEPVSRASANQRSGRCGRVAAGVCIRLFSEDSFRARPAFTDPEIRRSGLAGVILQMRSLGLGDIESFDFLDPPDAAAIKDGYETLFELGAITAPSREGTLTQTGRAMSRLPLDPRIARMLIAAGPEGSTREVLILAAALSIQDPRERPLGKQADADRAQEVFRHDTSDFISLLKLREQYDHAAEHLGHGALIGWCREHFVSAARMREWSETLSQLRSVAADLELPDNSTPAPEDAVHRALLTGLISNVACREGDAGSFDYRGVRGNVVSIFPGSVLFKKAPRWIMAAEIVHTSRLFARTIARVEPEWIEELAGHMFHRQLSDPHLDAQTGEPSAWERVSMSGIVVVPRRRTAIASLDPAKSRAIFLLDGLARAKWGGGGPADTAPATTEPPPFLASNVATLAAAQTVEAKLRRRSVIAPDDTIAAWFAARLPESVIDPRTLTAFLRARGPTADASLHLTLKDIIRPDALEALDHVRFPDTIALSPADPTPCTLTYALAPGQDHDGLTLTIPLTSLPALSPERAAWLIPGWLPELIASLCKSLPNPQRAAIEAAGPIPEIAAACAEVIDFASGPLPLALSETFSVLHSITIDPALWPLHALPVHLRLRVRVVDHHGAELGVGRDIPELRARFESRIRKAVAAEARTRFQRDNLTDWTFTDLPESVPTEVDGETHTLFPALIDHNAHVELTLVESAPRAEALTHAGLRRLFTLACAGEAEAHILALSNWPDLTRWYQALGTAEQLKHDLAALAAERAFISGMPPVRTRAEFESRKQECWGRLVTTVRDTADILARTLEPRAIVAQRLNRGTPRIWAPSIADIREHAAYLMPRGFLLSTPFERLRAFPKYAAAMRARLLNLREDGSGAETQALAAFAPHWKRFTGWVARAMSAERAAREEAEAAELKKQKSAASTKAPLPMARRAAPRVNLEAGEWAALPANLPPAVETFRWALEEARVTLFTPDLGGTTTLADLDALWAKADPTHKPAARR